MSKNMCPVCKRNVEDMRHVLVECFYKVNEIVPEMKDCIFMNEVSMKPTIWGKTFTYTKGTEDKFNIKETGKNSSTITTKQVKTKLPRRFVQTNGYEINCCKECRANFLTMLKSWVSGEKK